MANVSATPGNARVVLQGVDRYRVVEPMFEGVRVILTYRGETYSPAYIQGLSGAAFRVGGICPCAPTCTAAMEPQDLIGLLGYAYEYLPLAGEGIDAQTAGPRVLARVKEELRAGRPALVWHAFTYCEWDVVAGFDDTQGLFFGRGSYAGLDDYAQAPQERATTCGDTCPALGAILIGERLREPDTRAAELDALREAVRHAHSAEARDFRGDNQWVMLYSLECYDRWIETFRADPPVVPDMGDRYCFNVYRSTHRAAAEFLREIAPKYPQAVSDLGRAANCFATEADALHTCTEWLFPGGELPATADRATHDRVAHLLSRARDHYARAISSIEAALPAME
jgi:hypothetical protein